MDRRRAIAGQRVGPHWRWSEAEIALLKAGQPVPSRTPSSCQSKRHRLGIFTQPRNRKLPYRPPTPVPGEIPWPAWWTRAHKLRSEGFKLARIAEILNKYSPQVRVALYPDYREKCLLAKRQAYERIKGTPAYIQASHESKARQDCQRISARQHARAQWRESGGKPSDLERLYRRYECL